MSTEDRLARLGLLHLKDDPEALAQALKDGMDEYDAKVARWRAEQDKKLREQAAGGQPAADKDSEKKKTETPSAETPKAKPVFRAPPNTKSGVVTGKAPTRKL